MTVKSRKSKVESAGIGIILLVMAVLSVSCAQKKEEPLEKVTVQKGRIVASIPATGTVMPRNRLEIKPPVAGRVEQVMIEEGQSVRKGRVLAYMSSLERATLLDAARGKGEAEYKRWEALYKAAPIVAPINGFIILRSVEPGQSFSTNDIVLVMADILIVKAQVDETDIGRIKLGQKVDIVLDAYPETRINGHVGHIAYESQIINNVTVYMIDVIPDSVPSFFRSGMSATVNFSQNEKDGVLLLPLKAVKKRGKASYVFRFKEGTDRPEATRIEAGLEDDKNIEIVSGLSLGDTVVVPTADMVKNLGPQRHGPMPFNPFGGSRRQGQ